MISRIFIVSLILFSTCHAMQYEYLPAEPANIYHYALARYKQTINKELLGITHEEDENLRAEKLRKYYATQSVSLLDYMRKPVVNLRKAGAFLQLLRTTSLAIREETFDALRDESKELEMAPVDTKIIPRVKEVWPLVSIGYELEAMKKELNYIHSWLNGALNNTQKIDDIAAFLKQLDTDHQDIRLAINTCWKTK